MIRQWLRYLSSVRRSSAVRHTRITARRRPGLERLEERVVFSVVPLDPAELLANTTVASDQGVYGGDGAHGGRHTVAADSLGNYAIVWSGNGPGDASGVFFQRFAPDGTPLGAETRVNSTTSGDQNQASIAMDSSGDFAVLYKSGTNLHVRLFDSSGNPRSGEIRVGSKGARPQDIAMDADGDFVVFYENDRNYYTTAYYVQRFNASGAAQGKATQLALTNCANCQTSIAMDGDGDFIAAWLDTAQRFDRGGNPVGAAIPVGGAAIVDMDGAGNFLVSSHSPQAPFTREIQLYNADGSLRSAPFYSPATYAAIDMDGAGNVTLVWDHGISGDISGQTFDVNGVLLGDFTADTAAAGPQNAPSVATLPGGRLVAAWSGNGPGDNQGVFHRRFEVQASASSDGSVAEFDAAILALSDELDSTSRKLRQRS